MFPGLPHEVLEQMMDYSSGQDKWNLAKTSRQHFNIIKPLIWKKMKVTKKHLVSSHIDPTILENLKYTNELSVSMRLSPVIPAECIRLGFNVSCLLNAINPLKLRSLKLCGSCGDNLLLSMKHLSSLQHLRLRCIVEVEDTTWNHVCLPGGLKKLEIISCSVTNEFILSVVENCKMLENVTTMKCHRVTEPGLAAFTKATSLKSLMVYKIGSSGSKFDVSSLVSSLPDLKELFIGGISMAPNSFVNLLNQCSNLTTLEVLDLEISDQDFNRIHELQNLIVLSVERCNGINGSSFVATVSNLEKLETMKFDAPMFLGIDDPVEMRNVLSPLKEMASLERISISHDHRNHSAVGLQIVTALCWGDEEIWKIKVGPESDSEHVLTLSKV